MRKAAWLALALVYLNGLSQAAPAGPRDPKAASPNVGSSDVIWFEPSPLVKASALALDAGEYGRALELAEQALDLVLTPEDRAAALNNICIAQTYLQRFEEALETCDKLIRGSLPDWRYLNNRANAHLQSGDIDAAVADYGRALDLARAIEAQAETEAEVTPTGEEEAMKVSDILLKNLNLARERRKLGLEGVPVGKDQPQI